MLTVARTGEDLYRSTYTSLYNKVSSDTKKRKQYHEYPRLGESDSGCVTSKEHQDHIKNRKFVRPPGLSKDIPACLGLGAFGDHGLANTDKEITRMKGPAERVIGLQHRPFTRNPTTHLKRSSLEDLIQKVQMVSTTHKEEQPYCLPVPLWKLPNSTVEEHADMIRCGEKRYEDGHAEWQTATTPWDRVQYRQNYGIIPKRDIVLEKMKPAKKKKSIPEVKPEVNDNISINERCAWMADQCKERKIPGYAGFVPRDPVPCTFDKVAQEKYQSSASRAYRPFPRNSLPDFHPIKHFCVAPMSRMITLVYPSNPFKKTPNTIHTNIKPIFH